MTIYNINELKADRRERKRWNKKKKYIKHGEGVWKKQVQLQNTGLSRQWKKKIGIDGSKY